MNNQTVTLSLVYDDARRGIKWAVDILGLRVKSLFETPDGKIAFAELVWRTGIIFVSDRPPADNPWARVGVASVALVAEDAQAVERLLQRVKAAGADVVRPIHVARTPAFPEGSTQFDVRDIEGNLWSIGTFQPKLD
jgi:uncharacterized glyoxalase superfamily protein PhnB